MSRDGASPSQAARHCRDAVSRVSTDEQVSKSTEGDESEISAVLPAPADDGLAQREETGFAGRQSGKIPRPCPDRATAGTRALPGKHLGGFGADGVAQR